MTEDEKNNFGTSVYMYLNQTSKKDFDENGVASYLLENCDNGEKLVIFSEKLNSLRNSNFIKDQQQRDRLNRIDEIWEAYFDKREGICDEEWKDKELKWDKDKREFVEVPPFVLEQDNNRPNHDGDRTDTGMGNEDDDEKHIPEFLEKFKEEDRRFEWVAKDKTQKNYPYDYGLYKKGAEHNDENHIADLRFFSDKHVKLGNYADDNLAPFIETMNMIKANGGTKIELKLNGTEEEKRDFAALALVAGTLTGIKVDAGYRLEDLVAERPNIQKLIDLESKKAKINKAKEEYVAAGKKDKDGKETELETAIGAAYDSYRQIAPDQIPDKEALTVFRCGINAINDAKIKEIATRVYTAKQGGRS